MTDQPSGSPATSLSDTHITKFRKENQQGFLRRIINLFRSNNEAQEEIEFEDKIIEMIRTHDAENKISSIEGRMLLHNILEFGSLTVKDVMIPRTDVVAVDSKINAKELLAAFIEHAHARLPVYEGNLDNVIGFIHIKDVLPAFVNRSEYNLKKLLRPLIFTVSNMNIVDMLVKMRSARVHMALVLDEYGGVNGLVTIEDLLEEIVGSIEDEHDDDNSAPLIQKIDDKTYEINARASIEEVEYAIGMNIYDGKIEDCETIAGLIFLLTGCIPSVGEIVEHPSGIKFEILDADQRNVKQLRLIK